VGVLREFLDRSQFILVTHSKVTMAAADMLHGVTQRESGVSIRVSVRLEDVTEDGHIIEHDEAEQPQTADEEEKPLPYQRSPETQCCTTPLLSLTLTLSHRNGRGDKSPAHARCLPNHAGVLAWNASGRARALRSSCEVCAVARLPDGLRRSAGARRSPPPIHGARRSCPSPPSSGERLGEGVFESVNSLSDVYIVVRRPSP